MATEEAQLNEVSMTEAGDAPPAETAVVEEVPKVSEEFKSMVSKGNEEMPSNANSVGWGRQQIKLNYWNPENEKYWEVCFVLHLFFMSHWMFHVVYHAFLRIVQLNKPNY